jgi:hypothetical protein
MKPAGAVALPRGVQQERCVDLDVFVRSARQLPDSLIGLAGRLGVA